MKGPNVDESRQYHSRADPQISYDHFFDILMEIDLVEKLSCNQRRGHMLFQPYLFLLPKLEIFDILKKLFNMLLLKF